VTIRPAKLAQGIRGRSHFGIICASLIVLAVVAKQLSYMEDYMDKDKLNRLGDKAKKGFDQVKQNTREGIDKLKENVKDIKTNKGTTDKGRA